MFLNCLANQLDDNMTSVHFSKRLVSYSLPSSASSDSPITLTFKDGSKATCDVLIGADGIHSPTRHTMYELIAREIEARGSEEGSQEASKLKLLREPVWTGTVAYRALIPFERLMAINPNHTALTLFHNVRFVTYLTSTVTSFDMAPIIFTSTWAGLDMSPPTPFRT